MSSKLTRGQSRLIMFLALVGIAALVSVVTIQARQSDPDDVPWAQGSGTVVREGGENVLWKDVERLIDEQKFQEALGVADTILEQARDAGDEAEWTRALVQQVQLKIGLHGYETAVRQLLDEPWPEGARHQAVLRLFYASSLVTYVHAYSWEIRQREIVAAEGELDLKKWSLERIVKEANQAFLAVWKERDEWGSEPVASLARYVAPNDYPARIRGSLRDAVTYLWVQLLVDTSLWRPEQSNELFRLDVAKLIAGDPSASAKVDLADPQVHPLVKVGALLDDLEAWHRTGDRDEAEMEARLTRLRRLHAALSNSNDKEAIREHLEERQKRWSSSLEWWSMGQSALAELLRGEGEPDSLVRAREAAIAGLEAHPDSVGGRRCRHIVAAIEAPAYQLSGMACDSPDRRSLQVNHRNLEKLHFRAYRFDIEEHVKGAQDYYILPSHREVPEIMRKQQPVAEWSVQLPATPDYRSHTTFVTPPLAERGAYLVVASARADFAEIRNSLVAVHLILSDLVVLTRTADGLHEVAVRSGSTGDPVAGAEVVLYRRNWRQGHHRVASKTTGKEGIVTFSPAGWGGNSHFVLVKKGGDQNLDQGSLSRFTEPRRSERSAALVYTDRSVYRPQQTLFWKVVAYHGGGEKSRFNTLPGTRLTLTLVDANGEEVTSKAVTTNDFGSASGEMELPAGRLLGQWRLRTSIGGETLVRVEEYKRPTFEVTINEPEEQLRLNRSAKLEGEARYYFGLPVVTGDVGWRVNREPVYPPWWFWWWRPQPGGEAQMVASGTTELESDGSFAIEFVPEADERDAESGVTYRYRLTAEITDEGGETRSATRVFRLGFVAVEASIGGDTAFVRTGNSTTLTVMRTDLNGFARPGRGTWRLVELAQPDETLLPADQPKPKAPGDDAFHTPGDLQRPRWRPQYDPRAVMAGWEEAGERATGTLEHGDTGRAELTLEELPAGAYRLVYTTDDDFGATFKTSHDFVVTGPKKTPVALPALLLAERTSVAVGQTARLLVHSGLADQEMVLETHRDGRRVSRQVLRSGRDATLIEIPIGPDDRGGFGITLTVLRDHQLMRLSQTVWVPWDDRRLQVALSTFRDRLRPGTGETFTVTVRGADEKILQAGTAELLAYMYDRSLDIFAPHHPMDPLSVYPTRTGVGGVGSNLGQAQHAWSRARDWYSLPDYPTLSDDRLIFLDGYGIGGMGVRRMKSMTVGGEMMMARAPMPAMAMDAEAEGLAEEADSFADAELEEEPVEAAAEEESVELRTDFAETAFWQPHLLLGDDGTASIEFEVPDSVTEWNVWVHALTSDLRAGSTTRQTRSVKELMVRPYVPRFLREGDHAELKVVVNNAGETELSGTLDLKITDPDTDEDLLAAFGLTPSQVSKVPFTVEAGGGTNLMFAIAAPARIGTVAFTITARAGDFSDGELRPLPVLPGRMHLVQSRFVTLHDQDRRQMHFADMEAGDDSTMIHDQLVVTVDAQLFYSVLSALPYLVDYPYECTEQTLNRFLSTGILTSLFDDYPAVERMAQKFAARDTRLETWNEPDPNRKMLLEETPWLKLAQGDDRPDQDLINVLDPKIARAQQKDALAQLEKAQTSLGAFPWWPGGPPSPYMTLYILYGFSKALEFDVEVPKPMVARAWAYMHRHYIDELVDLMMKEDCCWETITFLNFVLSSYPDESWTGGVFTAEERRRMLDFSFSHWKEHSPLLKGYLTLTLKRAGRTEDARLVFDSVMDSSKTTQDEGTFWAPEDRAWLWYNDTIETHAFALRTLAELDPADGRRHGLVHWLLLNKKLNHWKSTRATSEVIYSLTHYLQAEGALGIREEMSVTVGPEHRAFVFEPDEYTGKKNQMVIAGDKIDPATMSTVFVAKQSKGFAFASATWHFSTEKLPEEARGDLFAVTRSYFRRVLKGRDWVLEPLKEGAELEPGDQLEVQLSVSARHAAEYVHLRDPRGAGFEPESTTSRYRWDLGIGWYEEIRDSGTNFFFDWLPAGEYTLSYRVRANMAGRFKVGPATLQSMYAPEFAAYSSGAMLEVVSE